MCCFSGSVESVTNTQIFGRLSGKETQFVVYQMQYESKVKTAMILPIPTAANATEDSVKFFDLKQYDRFFADLHRAFPPLTPPPTMSRAVDSKAAEPAMLKVQEVGDFVASVVPSVGDFSRLDPMFSISPETWAKIPIYNDYSFVVFQLEKLEGRPHPMAFEFKTRHSDKIFFPTVHIHDGEVHSMEEFDHTLLCQHAGFDNVVGSYTSKMDLQTGWTRSKSVAGKTVDLQKTVGIVAGDLLLHRKYVRGKQPNEDVFANVFGNPLTLQRSWTRYLVSLSPIVGVGALSIAWIVHRRNQRNQQSRSAI